MKPKQERHVYRAAMGWQVVVRRSRVVAAFRYFADSLHGGRRLARERALEWRDQVLRRLRPASLIRKRFRRNTTGVIGVQLARDVSRNGRPAHRFRASWYENDGRFRMVGFSIAKYGERKAKRLAVHARREAIARILAERKRLLRARPIG
jgi:hypothetical protein